MATTSAEIPEVLKITVNCAVCSLPLEYCEFTSSPKKCREWLEKTHLDLVPIIYNSEAIEAAMSNLSVAAQEKASRAEVSASKRAEKQVLKAEREAIKKASSRIILKRVERTKRKHVIVITGLESFGLDLKKAAKDFGKKFACGSSVIKGTNGQDEIVLQGDLSDGIMDYIGEKYPDVPIDNIDQLEVKKRGGGTDGTV